MTQPVPDWSPPFWGAWTVPKSDALVDENEDAHAAIPEHGVFAVADGATHSGFAGQWARLLVNGYVGAAATGAPGDWLAAQRQAWSAAVDPLEVPWFVAERREQGAFAAFLGISLTAEAGGEAGHWSAIAVGDACLFHIHNGQVAAAWPIEESAAFDNAPPLIGSRHAADETPLDLSDGTWQAGDYLLMMTDSLACWFLKETEKQHNPWAWMRKMVESRRSAIHYREVIATLRAARKLKDDDVTLVAIRV